MTGLGVSTSWSVYDDAELVIDDADTGHFLAVFCQTLLGWVGPVERSNVAPSRSQGRQSRYRVVVLSNVAAKASIATGPWQKRILL